MTSAKSALVALLLFCASASFADVAVPQIGRVVDQTGILSSDQVARLEQTLKDFEDRKGSQIAVLIVSTTQPETIEQYSLRVAEQWKLGRKKIDDGALLIIAKEDRKLRIEVGYGLEGALNDVTAKRIIDEIITPRFKNSDFDGGIEAGVARMISVIDGEPLPPPVKKSNPVDLSAIGDYFPFLFIGTIIVGGIFRTLFGRLLGATIAGGSSGIWNRAARCRARARERLFRRRRPAASPAIARRAAPPAGHSVPERPQRPGRHPPPKPARP